MTIICLLRVASAGPSLVVEIHSHGQFAPSLGRGAFGRVKIVKHVDTDEIYALKVLLTWPTLCYFYTAMRTSPRPFHLPGDAKGNDYQDQECHPGPETLTQRGAWPSCPNLTLKCCLLGCPREAAAGSSAAVPLGGASGVGNAGHELPIPPSGVHQRGRPVPPPVQPRRLLPDPHGTELVGLPMMGQAASAIPTLIKRENILLYCRPSTMRVALPKCWRGYIGLCS